MGKVYEFRLSKDPPITLHSDSRKRIAKGSLRHITYGEAVLGVHVDEIPMPPRWTMCAILAGLGVGNPRIDKIIGTTPNVPHNQLPNIYRTLSLQGRAQIGRHFLEKGYIEVFEPGSPLNLWPAEVEVVDGVSRGLTDSEIAFKRGTKLATVKSQLHAVAERTGWSGRERIATAAVLSGEIGEVVIRASEMVGHFLLEEPFINLDSDTFSASPLSASR